MPAFHIEGYCQPEVVENLLDHLLPFFLTYNAKESHAISFASEKRKESLAVGEGATSAAEKF